MIRFGWADRNAEANATKFVVLTLISQSKSTPSNPKELTFAKMELTNVARFVGLAAEAKFRSSEPPSMRMTLTPAACAGVVTLDAIESHPEDCKLPLLLVSQCTRTMCVRAVKSIRLIGYPATCQSA